MRARQWPIAEAIEGARAQPRVILIGVLESWSACVQVSAIYDQWHHGDHTCCLRWAQGSPGNSCARATHRDYSVCTSRRCADLTGGGRLVTAGSPPSLIKVRREAKNWSQEALAKIVGVHLSTFKRYENGDREMPLSVACALAEALDISVDELSGRLPAVSDNPAPLPAAAEVILNRRKQLGLTPSQVAATARIPLKTYLGYESGEDELSFAAAQALVEALDTTFEELAGTPSRSIDLNGQWWGAWQGPPSHRHVITEHTVDVLTSGTTLVLDRGYRGELELVTTETLVGWYRPPNGSTRTVQGVSLWLPADEQFMYGTWSGVTGNNTFVNGWCCLSRDEKLAREVVKALVEDNVQPRVAIKLPHLGGLR